uniref:Uncharacterized protein n=1 Tax=Rangifer tarandus platyrhynchus TaxID=3082113 RepID=A0ACB0FCQ9_RANTA|nr:unnamed protein product [Rangifer tarandus platyrhynchus]
MRLVTGVTVFLTLGTVINAKTTQPNSMDCAEGENGDLPPCVAMLSVTLLLLGMLFTARGTGAQLVTQPDGHISVSEGNHLELRCNYSYGGSINLFWYVQYPSQGLQVLLKYLSGPIRVKGIKGFEAEFKKDEKSFHLMKASAHWSDSAKYFCALCDTVPESAGGAEQKPSRHCSLKHSESQPDLVLERSLL